MERRWPVLVLAVIVGVALSGVAAFGADKDDDDDDDFMTNTYFKRQKAKQAQKKGVEGVRVRDKVKTRTGHTAPATLKKLADRNGDGVLSPDEMKLLDRYMASRLLGVNKGSGDSRRLVPPPKGNTTVQDEIIDVKSLRPKRKLTPNEIRREINRDARKGVVDRNLTQPGRVEAYRRRLDGKK